MIDCIEKENHKFFTDDKNLFIEISSLKKWINQNWKSDGLIFKILSYENDCFYEGTVDDKELK